MPVTDSQVVSLGFLVVADSDRPAARFYYTNTTMAGLDQCRGSLPRLTERSSLAALEEMADLAGYAERLADYNKRNANPKFELIKKFYEGRIDSTVTQQVDILGRRLPHLQGACSTRRCGRNNCSRRSRSDPYAEPMS